MIHLELAIVFILLVFLIRHRTPLPWRADMLNRITLAKLNRIEAAVRGIPIDEIEKYFANELEGISAKEKERPWFGSRPWIQPPLN